MPSGPAAPHPANADRRSGWCAELADLIWPASCAGCADTGAGSAPACRACLEVFRSPAVPTSPDPRPAWLPPLWAVADYAGAARSVMLAYKEQGVRVLAGPLGSALAEGLRAAWQSADGAQPPGGGGRVVVVPMPSSAAARRIRGDQPTLRMARAGVARLRAEGVPAELLPALDQRPGVLDQAGLSATARTRNLDGALRIRPRARRRLAAAHWVLLADDIVTSGATLSAAARVLAADDIRVAGAAVVAATRRAVVEAGRPTAGQRRATSRERPAWGAPADGPDCRLA